MKTARFQTVAHMAVVTILVGSAVLFAQESSDKTIASAARGSVVYEPGTKGITPPRAIYQPNPEYTDKARKKKLNGVVVLSLIVTPEGTARDVKVIKSLDDGLDKNAVAAVSTWRFDSATKDGKPVAMRVPIEVQFRLY
jgi:TonB family protein